MCLLNRNKFTLLPFSRYFTFRVRLVTKIAPLSTWLLCCFVVATNPSQAQVKENYFKTLTPNDGLLGNLNAFIFKDSRGFLWVSSMQGLNRYDGQRVRTYTHDAANPHALLNSNIQSEFYEDKNGDIWFCTVEAIHVYRHKQDHFDRFQIKDTLGEPILTNYYLFHLDTEGYLWIRVGKDEKGMLYRWHTNGKDDARMLHDIVGVRAKVEVNDRGLVSSVMTCMWGRLPAGVTEYFYNKDYKLMARKNYFSGSSTDPLQKNVALNVYKIYRGENTTNYWLATTQGLVK